MKVLINFIDHEIKSSFDGRYISIKNKYKGFFEIYYIDSLNIINDCLHPLSNFKKIYSGVALSIDWS